MKKHVWCIVLIIVVGVGAFFGGVYYQKSKMTTMGPGVNGSRPTGSMPTGSRGQNSNNGGSMPTDGEITAIDGDSITVKTSDGGSKIIILNSSTTISEMAETSKDKLSIGSNIMVTGTENSDKSVTAKSVQIRTNNN